MYDRTWELFRGQLASTFDRIQEAHWWLHHLHEYYHDPNAFRWCLNAFLRALREVDYMLRSELSQDAELGAWYDARVRRAAQSSLLLGKIVGSRNAMVHQAMLRPTSTANVGIWTGRHFRLALSNVEISPFEPTEDLGRRLLEKPTPLLWPDENEFFAIERVWRVEEWGDEDVLVLAEQAWGETAQILGDLVERLGGTALESHLECTHDPQKTRVKVIAAGADLPEPDWGQLPDI